MTRQYSQDSDAGNDGDLGWSADSMAVTPFEETVHKFKPGQISTPAHAQLGWYTIRPNDIRGAGTPEERQQNAIRQYLSQQKTQ